MKNKSLVMSIIAITISIGVLLFFGFRVNKPIDVEWTSSVIASLSLITTAAVGWQILNVLLFEKRIEVMKEELKKEIDSEAKSQYCLSYMLIGRTCFDNAKLHYSLYYYLTGIEAYAPTHTNSVNAIQNMNTTLAGLSNVIDKWNTGDDGDWQSLKQAIGGDSKYQIEAWIEALEQVKNAKKSDTKLVRKAVDFLEGSPLLA